MHYLHSEVMYARIETLRKPKIPKNIMNTLNKTFLVNNQKTTWTLFES
jgi:hypothetical protein